TRTLPYTAALMPSCRTRAGAALGPAAAKARRAIAAWTSRTRFPVPAAAAPARSPTARISALCTVRTVQFAPSGGSGRGTGLGSHLMPELAPGAVFSGHRIEAVVGRGGMGVVYRAQQVALGRTVALKVIAPELLDDPTTKARFLREARAGASI